MGYAVLFPGQGSQFVGMGADLFDLSPAFLGEAADEVLGWSLRSICLEGPEEALTSTDKAQPALYAVAYALW
ncbi:MAG: acyltransferase domain-containing protein, partial [Acidimicrobiia bacterium]